MELSRKSGESGAKETSDVEYEWPVKIKDGETVDWALDAQLSSKIFSTHPPDHTVSEQTTLYILISV